MISKTDLKIPVSAFAIAIFFAPVSSSAGTWKSEVDLSVREIYSDNIELVETEEESDFVTDVTPSIVITGQGRRATLDLSYSIQNLFYADNSDRDNTNHRLNTRVSSEVIEDFMFFDASGRISQQLTDTRDGVSRDRISGAGNLEDLYGYSLSPSIKPRFGDYLQADIGYTYDYVEYGDESQSFQDSEGNSLRANLVNGQATANLYWDLSYASRDIDYDDGDKTETELAQGRIGFRLGNKWSIYATGTHEDNTFTGDRGDNVTPDDSSYGGGISWQPNPNFRISAAYNERSDPRPDEDESFSSGDIFWSPTQRTELTGSWGQRFFGETYNLRFNHRMRRSSWQVAYNERVSDFRQQFLSEQLIGGLICPTGVSDFQQCRVFDENNPPGAGEEVVGVVGLAPSISENTFISKVASASWSIKGGRTVITLGASNQQREFVNDGAEEEDLSANFSWSYKLAPRTTTEFVARLSEREFDVGDQSDEIYVRWALRRDLTPKTRLALEASYTDREADRSENEYTEKRGILSLQHTF